MFAAEKDLVYAFKNVASDFIEYDTGTSSPPFFLLEEFDSHFGIADIVMGTCTRLSQKDLSRDTINLNWVRPIFNLIEDQEITTDAFTQSYGISKTTARIRLKEYSDAGFIKKLTKGHYRVIREYKVITDTIIAIEAKLKNWKQALYQAMRYQRFSNKSYVLLDRKHVKPALKNIHVFKKKNIGLLSMNDEDYIIHHNPTTKEAPQTHSFFRLNEAAFNFVKMREEAYA